MYRFSLRRRSTGTWIGLLVLASALLACSTEVEVRTSTATTMASDAPPDTPAGGDETSGSTGAAASESDGASPDEPDPGADDPLHTPARGEAVAVVGVAYDESVAVRRAARSDATVIAELAPLFEDVVGTGQGRTVGTTGWWRIGVGGRQGWVEASSMARLGATSDVTDDVVAALGEIPVAPTIRALGRLVAQTRRGDVETSVVVLSAPPRDGDRSEVVYDIVDRGDASIVGERLVVLATPTGGGDGVSLDAVEATTFCARGVTADGRCT